MRYYLAFSYILQSRRVVNVGHFFAALDLLDGLARRDVRRIQPPEKGKTLLYKLEL